MAIRKAIIPAAGLGTRFLPATKALPKEMLPIVDKPVMQFIIEEAVHSGIEDILIITGRNKRAIEDHFDRSYQLEAVLEERGKEVQLQNIKNISSLANIHYIRQKAPNGLGEAVLQAKHFIGDEPFALLLGDDIVEIPDMDPCTLQLIKEYEKSKCPIIGVQTVSASDISRYGIVTSVKEHIDPGENLPVYDLMEKPALAQTTSRIAIMGRYILEPTLFHFLEKQHRGLGGEVQLSDALSKLNTYSPIRAYGFWGKRHDVGDPLGFLRANLSFALKHDLYAAPLRALLEELLKSEVQPWK